MMASLPCATKLCANQKTRNPKTQHIGTETEAESTLTFDRRDKGDHLLIESIHCRRWSYGFRERDITDGRVKWRNWKHQEEG